MLGRKKIKSRCDRQGPAEFLGYVALRPDTSYVVTCAVKSAAERSKFGSSPVSYLDTPRVVFTGEFQADVSTINNDVRYFQNTTFQKEYQDLSTTGDNGGWNPEGTGIFRFVGCRITGAQLGNQHITSAAQDPIIGMALENADDRVFGKLVDLDPQQQMVSQIWGMQLRLDGGAEKALFRGNFVPVAFTNLWRRQKTTVFLEQALGAVYQSVLRDVIW